MARETNRTNARRRRTEQAASGHARRTYRQLPPFWPQSLWSDDRRGCASDITACLEELGIKVLLPEARRIFAKAGARVCEDTEFVWIGKDMVEEALGRRLKASACALKPKSRAKL